jgi:microcystin-dependent protein
MAEAYLSEIRMFSFEFTPRGWALCNGQLLSIFQHQGLFSLLGTTYGGDGHSTFRLPDLQGRTPIGIGYSGIEGWRLGESAGVEQCTLTEAQLPSHTHILVASDAPATLLSPHNAVLGQAPNPQYSDNSLGASLETSTYGAHGAVAIAGSSVAHSNMQPYLTLNFCICLMGVFPSRE